MDNISFDSLSTTTKAPVSQAHEAVSHAIEGLISVNIDSALLFTLPQLMSDSFRSRILIMMHAVDSHRITPSEIGELIRSIFSRASRHHFHSNSHSVSQSGDMSSPVPVDFRQSVGTIGSAADSSYYSWDFDNPRTSIGSSEYQVTGASQGWPDPESVFGNPPTLRLMDSGVSESTDVQPIGFFPNDKLQPQYQLPDRSFNFPAHCVTTDAETMDSISQNANAYEGSAASLSTGIATPHERALSEKRSFIAFEPQKTRVKERPSFCPECNKDFTSTREFECHIDADHDRPAEFRCLHPITMKGKVCNQRFHHPSRFRRHHTTDHSECSLLKSTGQEVPTCCQRTLNHPLRRFWGCGLCTNLSHSLKDWVTHHTQFHRGQERSASNYATLLQSYLSHSTIGPIWQNMTQKSYHTTDGMSLLRWISAQDADRHGILQAFKTGIWRDRDVYKDVHACHDLVNTMLRIIQQNKVEEEALSQEQDSSDRNFSSQSRGRSRSFRSTLLKKRSKSILNQSRNNAAMSVSETPQLPTNSPYLMGNGGR